MALDSNKIIEQIKTYDEIKVLDGLNKLNGNLTPETIEKLLELITNEAPFISYKILFFLNENRVTTSLKKIAEIFKTAKFADIKLICATILSRCNAVNYLQFLVSSYIKANFLNRVKYGKYISLAGKNAVPELLKLLENPEMNTDQLIDILSFCGKNNIAAIIDKYKNSKFPYVKQALLKVMAKIKNPNTILMLIKSLNSTDRNLCDNLVDMIVSIGESTIPILKKVLETKVPVYSYYGSIILSKLGETGENTIYELLEVDNEYLKKCLINSLSNFNNEKSIDTLINFLSIEEFGEAAANALGKIGKEAYFQISKKFDDKNFISLLYSLKALSFIDDFRAKDMILSYLNLDDTKPENIEKVLAGLLSIRGNLSKELVAINFEKLKTKNSMLYETAIDNLIEIANDIFLNLIQSARNPNLNVSFAILRILSIFKQEFNPRFEFILSQGNEEEKFNVAYILGEIGTIPDIELLKKVLNDGNDWVRKFAEESIVKISDKFYSDDKADNVKDMIKKIKVPEEKTRQMDSNSYVIRNGAKKAANKQAEKKDEKALKNSFMQEKFLKFLQNLNIEAGLSEVARKNIVKFGERETVNLLNSKIDSSTDEMKAKFKSIIQLITGKEEKKPDFSDFDV